MLKYMEDTFAELRQKPNGNGGMDIRFKEINRLRNILVKAIETRKTLSKRYKRLYNALHTISVGSVSINVVLAGATIGVLSNPVTLMPLAVTGVGLATVSTITGVWSKLVNKRIVKHGKLFIVASNALNNINSLLSEALKDGHISDLDFKKILDEYQEYIRVSKNIKDTFIRKTFVEKDDIKSKIDAIFDEK